MMAFNLEQTARDGVNGPDPEDFPRVHLTVAHSGHVFRQVMEPEEVRCGNPIETIDARMAEWFRHSTMQDAWVTVTMSTVPPDARELTPSPDEAAQLRKALTDTVNDLRYNIRGSYQKESVGVCAQALLEISRFLLGLDDKK